jgi:hypothetical protein
MRRLQTWTSIAAAALIATATTANAKTYRCEASPKRALLGLSAFLAVSITEDTSNQECRFSVNGEPVGSPPRALVIGAYNVFRSGEAARGAAKWDTFAYSLLASSPGDSVPGRLRDLLEKYSGELTKCVSSLAGGQPGTYVSDSELVCRVERGDGDTQTIGFGGGGIQVRPTTPNDPPQLVLGYNGGTLRHYLFIPMTYVTGRLPPLP